MFKDLLISLPAIIYYGLITLWRRITTTKTVCRYHAPYAETLVIYIHGRNGSPVDMYSLSDYIRGKISVKNELFIDLPERQNRTIGDACKNMDATVLKNSVLKVGVKKVFIIGLSKGGLVAYNFLRLYGANHFPTGSVNLITLGSPLQGDPLANYSPLGVDRKNFGDKSEYLLDRHSPIPRQCSAFYSVSCSNDHMVPRKRASFPDNIPSEHYHHEDYFCSHMGIPYNKGIHEQVVQWMK